MSAYLFMQITITDPERWAAYREAVLPLAGRYGGRHLTGGAPPVRLEGEADGRRIAMFAFPSMEAVRAFWTSPDYGPVRELRRDAAILDVWAIPGSDDG